MIERQLIVKLIGEVEAKEKELNEKSRLIEELNKKSLAYACIIADLVGKADNEMLRVIVESVKQVVDWKEGYFNSFVEKTGYVSMDTANEWNEFLRRFRKGRV